MSQETTKVELGDVQETLLIPLYFRAMESTRPNPLFRDQKATEILPTLEYDFSEFDQAWALRNDVVIRTVIFDELVADFIKRNPNGRIINLGAGLDARFYRLDNGSIRWYDLDMPDSISLRKRFFPIGERNTLIAKSMFDTSWFDEVGEEAKTLVVAEALFIYFDEPMIRDLFEQLLHRFAGAEIVFQSTSPSIVGRKASVPILRKTKAELKWGIASGRSLTKWNPDYEFLGEWSLVDRFPERWRWYRWVMRIPHVGKYIREVMKITHLRFANAAD